MDWNRPYGIIYGNHPGSYEQDGIIYDGQGNPIIRPESQAIEADVEQEVGSTTEHPEQPIADNEDVQLDTENIIEEVKPVKKRKYSSQLSATEARAELDEYGVEYNSKLVRRELRQLVKAERVKRGLEG